MPGRGGRVDQLVEVGAGQVEHACEVAESAARDVMATDSATVRSDMRQLRSALTTRSKHPAVRHALPVIAASLRGAPHGEYRGG